MNKKLKITLIFLSGWLCGVLSIAIIIFFAIYNMHRKGGSPLVEPKIYGDVRIYHWNSGDELEHQIGLADHVIVEKDKECFIALNFDEQRQFSGFSFWNEGNNILSYTIPHKYKDHDSVFYGTLEQNLRWIDWNCDGIFDLQRNKNDNTKEILVNDEWVKVKTSSKRVIVKIDGTEIEYDFNRVLGKWLPKSESGSEE